MAVALNILSFIIVIIIIIIIVVYDVKYISL